MIQKKRFKEVNIREYKKRYINLIMVERLNLGVLRFLPQVKGVVLQLKIEREQTMYFKVIRRFFQKLTIKGIRIKVELITDIDGKEYNEFKVRVNRGYIVDRVINMLRDYKKKYKDEEVLENIQVGELKIKNLVGMLNVIKRYKMNVNEGIKLSELEELEGMTFKIEFSEKFKYINKYIYGQEAIRVYINEIFK